VNVTRHRVLAQGTALIGIAASFGAASRAARAQGVPAMQIGRSRSIRACNPCMHKNSDCSGSRSRSADHDHEHSAAEVAALAADRSTSRARPYRRLRMPTSTGFRSASSRPPVIYTGPVGNTNLMVAKTSPVKSGADISGKTVAVSALTI